MTDVFAPRVPQPPSDEAWTSACAAGLSWLSEDVTASRYAGEPRTWLVNVAKVPYLLMFGRHGRVGELFVFTEDGDQLPVGDVYHWRDAIVLAAQHYASILTRQALERMDENAYAREYRRR